MAAFSRPFVSLLPAAVSPPAPLWLTLVPDSGDLLLYNWRRVLQCRLADADGGSLRPVPGADWSRLAELCRPLQLVFAAAGEDADDDDDNDDDDDGVDSDGAGRRRRRQPKNSPLLLAVGDDGRCRLADPATSEVLATTLGQHSVFGAAVRGRHAYLVDYEQEVLLRFSWPVLRNACALSLVKKSESAFCTIFDSAQPWHVANIGGNTLVTIGYGNSTFDNRYAAVCLNPETKTWTGELLKPAAASTDAAAADQEETQAATSRWLPGDRYVAYDAGSKRLFLSSHREQAVYCYAVSWQLNGKRQRLLQFRCVASTRLPGGAAFPGSLAFDARRRMLHVLAGVGWAGADRVVTFQVR